MDGMSDRARGLGMALAGIVVLLPDTILFRLIDSDVWTIMVWRAAFQGLVLWIALLLIHRRNLPARVRATGRTGIGFALAMGLGAICFNLAIAWTTVANTLFLLAALPLWSALLSRLLLGEPIGRRTILTIAAAAIGIAIIVSGKQSSDVAHWSGDLAALAGSICMAFGFTLARRHPRVSMVPALAAGATLPVLFGTLMGGAVLPLPGDMPLLLVMGAVIQPLSFALIATAPRYISSFEVSLFMLLEAALAPLLVWWIVGEDPGPRAILGGAIVILAVAVSNLIALRRAR